MHAILHALYVELVLEVEFNIYTQLLLLGVKIELVGEFTRAMSKDGLVLVFVCIALAFSKSSTVFVLCDSPLAHYTFNSSLREHACRVWPCGRPPRCAAGCQCEYSCSTRLP